MSRQARTTVPAIPALLEPKAMPPKIVARLLQDEIGRQKKYYDRQAKPLGEFKQKDRVRIYDVNDGIWKPGTGVRVLTQPRFYYVQENHSGVVRRRNRRTLRSPKVAQRDDDSPSF